MPNCQSTPDPVFREQFRKIAPVSRCRKIEKAVKLHFEDESRWDRRGRKSSELKRVLTTLNQIVSMQKWCEEEWLDLNLRRLFRKYLKHIDHRASWSVIEEKCSRARYLYSRADQRRISENLERCPETKLDLSEGFSCIRLNTVNKLRSAGFRAGNCLVNDRNGYHTDLILGNCEFWEIQKANDLVALACIDLENGREFTVLEGPANRLPDLPINILWKLPEALNACGDGMCEFIDHGVDSLFWKDGADPKNPQLTVGDVEFWGKNGKLVIHDVRDGSWSTFRFSFSASENPDGCWLGINHSALSGAAVQILGRIDSEIGSLLAQAKPKSCETEPRRPKRRRRRMWPH